MPSLNETATTTAIVNGKAATWRLAQPDSPEPAESAELPRDGSTFYSESIIGTDGRTPVNEADIRDGGKYRSIVKILSCFNDGGESVWMMGTGWLIRPDLLVTAGHVVYDWGHGYRAATQIKCYIGYKGRESVETDICQARYGQTIVTTAEWIQTTESRPRDVAFIKVTKPFTGNLRLFNYVDTPSKDSATLGVVGYPGDMSYNNEKGGEMYEQFKMTEYNLNTSDRHMIRYKLSTFGGQSGAPIIRKQPGPMTSIGTHCYGGGGKDSNSGNAIGGQWGNDYTSFIKLFALDQSTFGTPTSIEYMDPNNTGGIINRSGTEQEGFRDVFKSIARIGSSTAPLVGSLLGGPIGGIIGTVAGGFLGSLSEVAAAAAESTFEDTGAAERAILAEACLQTILQLPSDHPATKNIIDHMQRNYTANAPNVDVLAQVITPQITEAALEITAARYIKAVSRAARPESTESVQGYSDLLVSKPESAVGEGEAFAEGLFSPTRQLTGEEASEIFSWLGPVLKKAVSVGRPLLSKAAKAIITDVAPKLLGQIVGTIEGGTGSAESVMQNPIMMSRKQPQVRLLLKRALIADAALQALQALPADQLRSVQTKPEPAGSQAEGIFDSIKKVVQKIGPAVLDTTKQAIKTVAPILLNAAAKQLKDIINPGGVSGGGVAPVDPPIGPVHSGSVLDDLLSGSSNPIQVSNNVQLHSRMLVAPPVVFHERVRQQPVLIPDLTAELSRRDEEWETSTEHRKSWDSNDDFMPILEGPPPEDF